jgi:hypothetical protein
MARTIKPIARLHNQRNALQERVTALEQPSIGCGSSAELGRLRDLIAYTKERRAKGHLVEFDYPYAPRVRHWEGEPGDSFWRQIIASGSDRYSKLLTSFLAYGPAFAEIPNDEPKDEQVPYWSNPWFPVLDGVCLSGLLAKLNPQRYIEVGSGNSTKFARFAISAHNLRTRILSIDPAPRAIVDTLCDEVIRRPLEDCDLTIFNELGPEDVIFVDNSHRGFQNSDVTVFFTEVLPILRAGCYYGMHDIFLPNDYPKDWLARFYNEQYFLMTYLLGGARSDEIVLPVHYVQLMPELRAILEPIVRGPAAHGTPLHGGAFWLRRA